MLLSPRNLIMLAILPALMGCSVVLDSVGWLDPNDKNQLFEAKNKHEFEHVIGDSVYSKKLLNDEIVRIYEYLDGDKYLCANGSCGKISAWRNFDIFYDILFVGMAEPILFAGAIKFRSEAKTHMLVIYDSNDCVLAICQYPDLTPNTWQPDPPYCERPEILNLFNDWLTKNK